MGDLCVRGWGKGLGWLSGTTAVFWYSWQPAMEDSAKLVLSILALLTPQAQHCQAVESKSQLSVTFKLAVLFHASGVLRLKQPLCLHSRTF
ncbi:hypothetical protein JZ751_003885, partial [Albula glossodonta]